MVGVIIIAVLFTALAGGIFWAAGRGRLTPVTDVMLSQSSAGRRVINVLLASSCPPSSWSATTIGPAPRLAESS